MSDSEHQGRTKYRDHVLRWPSGGVCIALRNEGLRQCLREHPWTS